MNEIDWEIYLMYFNRLRAGPILQSTSRGDYGIVPQPMWEWMLREGDAELYEKDGVWYVRAVEGRSAPEQ